MTKAFGRDITITQAAELKILMPILEQAIQGGNGAINLNMVGPIYIGGVGETTDDPAGKKGIEAKPIVVSTDNFFDRDMTMKEFISEARSTYLRIVATRCNYDMDKLVLVLGIGPRMIGTYAKQAGIRIERGRRG
jgi:hypothetical protein